MTGGNNEDGFAMRKGMSIEDELGIGGRILVKEKQIFTARKALSNHQNLAFIVSR